MRTKPVTLTNATSSARVRPERRRRRILRGALLLLAMAATTLRTGISLAADIPADLQIDLSSIAVSKDELMCLALNDYWEARSEDIGGRIAVARVVLNRVMDPRFPSTICDVVKQPHMQSGAARCQFSWYCDHRGEPAADSKEWRDSLKIAAALLQKDSAIPDPTGGALWYHADSMRPNWALGFESTTIIGSHVFYREPDDLDGPPAPRRPFIYRLNAFAEFVSHRDGRRITTVAMRDLSVAVKDSPMPSQPVAR
jgi:N-acetylmuramoyl-L-alanine amidase